MVSGHWFAAHSPGVDQSAAPLRTAAAQPAESQSFEGDKALRIALTLLHKARVMFEEIIKSLCEVFLLVGGL